MKLVVYIATSLDGYIATKEGNIDWLVNYPNPEKSDFGFSIFLSTIDAILMGRKTFETVLGFPEWPYTKPVFVLTNTLKTVPPALVGKVEYLSGNEENAIGLLKERGLRSIYVDGGALIHSLVAKGKVHQLILSRIPVLLGDGIPLFPVHQHQTAFEHENTEVFSNGIVKSSYRKT